MAKLCEQFVAAHAELAHDLGVDVGDRLADRCIEFVKREEAPVTQPCQHEPLNDLDRYFHLRLVAWLAHTRGQDRGVVMLGQLLVGAIDARLVATGDRNAGL